MEDRGDDQVGGGDGGVFLLVVAVGALVVGWSLLRWRLEWWSDRRDSGVKNENVKKWMWDTGIRDRVLTLEFGGLVHLRNCKRILYCIK